jgi:hypothetical protein
MADEHKQTHKPIRTFAQDLADARNRRGQSHPDSSFPNPEKVSSVETEKEVENHTAQAPAHTTHTEQKITVSKIAPTIHTPEPVIKDKKETKPVIAPKIEHIKSDPTPAPKAKQSKVVPKISVKKTTGPKKQNIGYDTAIITDNKNERFNLFQAVGISLNNWFKTLTFSKKKKAPIYTVPDTERRKGVIKKATSKSGSIFTADSAELRAKIKQRQKQAEAAKHNLQEEGELNWSPYTDAGYNLIESPEAKAKIAVPHNVSVEFKKSTTKLTESPTQIPQVPEAPDAAALPAIETPKTIDIDETPSRWEVESPTQIPEPVVEVPAEVPAEEMIPTEETNVESTSLKPKRGGQDFNLQSLNTNVLAMSIVAGISMIIVIFLVINALLSYINSSEAVVTYNTTSYLKTATQNPVTVQQVNTLTDIPLQAGVFLGVDYADTQLFLENGVIVPPENIVAALGFNLLPSFTKSLTDIRFAQKNKSAPIIILEFSTSETALGGLLAWEDTMASDLKELYLITQVNDSVFIDDTIGNKDVRILKSTDGDVLAVYGIIANDTAIITSSVDIFSQVLNASFTE